MKQVSYFAATTIICIWGWSYLGALLGASTKDWWFLPFIITACLSTYIIAVMASEVGKD